METNVCDLKKGDIFWHDDAKEVGNTWEVTGDVVHKVFAVEIRTRHAKNGRQRKFVFGKEVFVNKLNSCTKTVRTVKDIQEDERIDRFIKNYDGPGKHMVECKDGYRFEGERTIDIGTVAEICDSINKNLEPVS